MRLMSIFSLQSFLGGKKSLALAIYLSFFIIIISGCEFTGEVIEIDSYAVDDGSIKVYFCPQDNCSAVLVDFIMEADSVDCAFYDLELEKVIEALDLKRARVIGNERERWGIMHNKFCVTDCKVITGSFNPTYNGNYKNNNNLLVIDSRLIANNYKAEFEEMWNGVFGKGNKVLIPEIDIGFKVENYFCPEDNCAYEIIEEINKAEKSIYFMTFSFTHDNIADSLALALSNGVEVKGIIESSGETKYSKFDFLEFQGVDIIKDSNKGKMHHKVFIIDNRTVITGSMNPTASGDERNDENILVIHSEEIASRYLEEFEKIYK